MVDASAESLPDDTAEARPDRRGHHLDAVYVPSHRPAALDRRKLALLSLTALGVVYGDIGTSPLYAIKESFRPSNGLAPTPANVYGILSLIVWSLTLVVSIKYIVFILKADNHGEGGILALLALVLRQQNRVTERRRRAVLVVLGLFGAALLYGDGVITPAISVLSAAEGMEVAAPALTALVVPITALILFGLFMLQRFGTNRVGVLFGPVMALWFASIAALGIPEIAREPQILLALNPWYAVRFFMANGTIGFFALGSVVLAVTGAEALYADMGHFGRRPIRIAWFALVFPALLLNYFGQGALLLRVPGANVNPFYRLAPPVLLYPLLILATTAAVVASQALISGAFSLTQQAVQLGYSPRVTIRHTSKETVGQVYIKEVNTALMIGSIALVLYFRSSDNLAAAYGIAVTGTMAITTLLFFTVSRKFLRWSLPQAIAFAVLFLAIDLSFLGANVVKISHGGWVPLVIAAAVYILMSTWKRGRTILSDILTRASVPLDMLLADIAVNAPVRVPGTAVFMTRHPEGAPLVLLHHLKHNKVLHENVILLSIVPQEVPEVPADEHMVIEPRTAGFYRVMARYGFMETPVMKDMMDACARAGIPTAPGDTTYYLGRERLLVTGQSPMQRWRKHLFAFMSRNARGATEFFRIPPNRVVELGTQIEF